MLTSWQSIFGSYTPLTDINGVIYPNYEMIFLYIFFIVAFYWFMKFLFSLFKN